MQIAARKKDWPKEKASVTLEYPMPANLEALTSEFGGDVVYNKAVDSIVIDVQSNMRRILSNEKLTDAAKQEALAKLTTYKPSATSTVRRTPQERIEDLAGKMTPDEKKALIAKLREDLKAAA